MFHEDTVFSITDKGKQVIDIIAITPHSLREMAWLTDMAAIGCAAQGMHRWATELLTGAKAMRARAQRV